MSKMLKRFVVGRTGNRYPWRRAMSAIPMDAEVNLVKSDHMDGSTMDEWTLSLKIMTSFKCRPIDRERALRNAETMLLQEIYKGMLGHIVLLRTAVYGGDVEGAMALLDEMEQEMGRFMSSPAKEKRVCSTLDAARK